MPVRLELWPQILLVAVQGRRGLPAGEGVEPLGRLVILVHGPQHQARELPQRVAGASEQIANRRVGGPWARSNDRAGETDRWALHVLVQRQSPAERALGRRD